MYGYAVITICMCYMITCCHGASYGEDCTSSNCDDGYQICDSTTDICECITDYTMNDAGNACAGGLEKTCLTAANCADPAALCTGYTCTCNTATHYDSNGSGSNGGTCTTIIPHGDACSNAVGAEKCEGGNTECSGTTCQCIDGHYWNNAACVTKVNVGGTCPSTVSASLPCSDSNAVCTNTGNGHKCQCETGYYNYGGTCELKKQLGVSCSSNAACSDSNAECNGQCVCLNGFYDSTGTGDVSGTCTPKVTLGGVCPTPTTDVPKTSTCSDSVATCEDDDGGTHTCTCPDTHYDNNGQCTLKKLLSETCPNPNNQVPATASCADTNARCTWSNGNYGCTCISTHFDNDGTSSTGGLCEEKKALGAICPSTSVVSPGVSCSDANAVCQQESGTYKCRCSSNYYDNDGNDNEDGQCINKVILGSNCPMEDACSTSNSQCVGGTCVCLSDFYDSNKDGNLGGNCKERKGLNVRCTERSSTTYNNDQCDDQFATCNSNKYCTCNVGYHPEGTSCIPNKSNGDECTEECSDPNAQCMSSVCTCGPGFYDDNLLVKGGKCEAVSQLQVGSVVFSDIQTTRVTVSWSHPAGMLAQYVNYYTVQWSLKNTVDYTPSYNLGSSTSYVMNGITPGKIYNVQIISHNTQTESGEERTTSVTNEQAAKPNMVGGITSSETDLDVSDGTLRIVYTAATNGKSGYIVQLFDGTTKIAQKSRTQSQTAVTIYDNSDVNFNNRPLKNGYRYTVRIITLSETFDNGKTVNSEEFEDVIKTTPKTPESPQSGQCVDTSDNAITDSSITVSWNPPTLPNGDIVRYHVRVYLDYQYVITRSTASNETQLKVDGLPPGTSYQFTLMTENEVGNSTQTGYISTRCKTKAKMADAPNNLQISDVTSRSMIVTWDKPTQLYSEENFGYDLQIKDDQNNCVIEILYECSDCSFNKFQFSQLTGTCPSISKVTELRTKAELGEKMTYTASLDPYALYTVSVTAINGAGRGYEAVVNETTREEAPKKPTSVSISDITSTTFTVSWSIDGVRPGKTTYDVKIQANSPASSIDKSVEGFYNRSLLVTGVEEYWNYSVSVIAKTSIGSMESDARPVQTLSAAPGKVSEFTITPNPDGNYTLMKVSWKAPTILDRNGVIKEYNFEHNATESTYMETYSQETSMEHVYEKMVSVTPKTYYQFKVTAVNEDDESGDVFEKTVMAPEEIVGEWSDWSEWTPCSVTCDRGSQIRTRTCTDSLTGESSRCAGDDTDIQSCNKPICPVDGGWGDWTEWSSCSVSCGGGTQTHSRICDKPTPYNGGRQCDGDSTYYRNCKIHVCPVVPFGNQCSNGAGADKCAGDHTGCLGGTCQCMTVRIPPESSDMTALVVGVVLGLIILVVVAYGGYVTIKLRRYINKEQAEQTELNKKQQPTYVNEMFQNVSAPDGQDGDAENPASEYSTLSDETREPRSTYDIIRV